jgi:AraC-like DNA-binding protein
VKIPKVVLVLHDNVAFLGTLRRAAESSGWTVRRISSWESLLDEVRSAPASVMVVVDPYSATPRGQSISIEVASLLSRFPSLAITAALHVRLGRLDDVRRLGEWGVVQVIDLDEELVPWAVKYRLQTATGRPLRSLVEGTLPAHMGGPARSILASATEVVVNGGTGADLARRLHITTRTLLRWCRKAGLPPPRRLLAWMRMLLAAELLDDPGRTVSDAALSCGYASDGSLRNAMRSFLEQSPGEMRDRGAFAFAAEAFIEELRRARSPQARFRSPSSRHS